MSLAAIGDVACIAVAAITVPDSHARRRIDDEDLDSLARSIEEVGLLQPIVVRPLGNGRYELLAGARRLRAVQALGRAGVPAVAVSHESAAVLSLVENTQRQGLDALELAEALQRLVEQGWGREALARLVGRSTSWVGDLLSLNRLPDWIKAEYAQVRRVVSRSLLVEVARVRDAEAQAALWREARGGALTVRQARRMRREALPALPRALSAVRRCARQLDRIDAAPDLAEADRSALLALRDRIDALLAAGNAGSSGQIGPPAAEA
ncbi:ParB family chromosome partitioning protein [Azospirillum lipoferum]|uniref:ParB/RepB/Spo0J family partition protein n=2 Tax=Azospirillum lipoferum TaxID=193 RepID=A0A5A9GLY2_AZOLI|nr:MULTISPECIES: ParB/RepB/Spo0J family partition protein [Azospirillum]KAA0595373.1 ParB/RepB/Spo0J family partition protein [Azospirillum lipoferum]MCP1611733.1 ParB family chromosome partitioning protein [Azospirillum lipoferum]MDW5533509.1 ParB/RepB/Spo0J family partition protein [Azospirillum sp. NL1]